ncbi:MAG TPA: hypothetical protein VGR14_00485 [Verrucomicrobiae bacterium]|jgi:hypothetical protein|nr:hypothetical protein [Verrucomicrobiae bacterium]
MNKRRKGQLAAVAILAAVVCVLLAVRNAAQPPIAKAVTISFIGFTNFPSNIDRFARFTISNAAAYDVVLRGFGSEVEGGQHRMAPIVDLRMPECHFVPVLKGRDAVTYAIGEPSDETASAPWRFDLMFAHYDMSARWFDVVWRRPWLQRLGAMRLVKTEGMFDPTNCTTISSPWLKR